MNSSSISSLDPLDRYSVTTEELLSIPDSCDGFKINQRLTLINTLEASHIKELKKYFFFDDDYRKGHALNKNDFVAAVCSITGSDLLVVEAEKFFEKVCVEDQKSNGDVLTWKQILDEIRRSTQSFSRDATEVFSTDESHISMHLMLHCRHEPVVKVLSMETEEFFCYTVFSQFGQVGIYDGRLKLLREYVLQLFQCSADSARTTRRRRNTWINDAVYMSDAQFIAVAASDGTLHFIDTVCRVHVPTFSIMGLKNTPTCLEYCPGNTSLLFIGDDKGCITNMEFRQPKRSLFKRDPTNKVDTYLLKDLELQQEWVKIHMSAQQIHPDGITHITYCQSDNTTLSCCQSSKKSLVIKQIRDRWNPYIFNIRRGVRCFHYSEKSKLLITGCSTTVYVWNPVVTKLYLAKLNGHKKSVVDVRILEHSNVVISISKDEIVKVWNIGSYDCLQTVQFDFPVYNVLGKAVEFSGKIFYPGPVVKQPPEEQQASLKSIDVSNITNVSSSNYVPVENWDSDTLLVVCSNYVATLKQTSKGNAQKHSPLPPPLEDKEPILPSEWSFSDADRIDIDEVHDVRLEFPRVENDSIREALIGSRPLLDHEAFDLDTYKKIVDSRTKKNVDNMVKNGTPHLAMHLCPVNKLEISEGFRLGEVIKSQFPFLERVGDLLNDGVVYDDKVAYPNKDSKSVRRIDVDELMDVINRLELDEDEEDFEKNIHHLF